MQATEQISAAGPTWGELMRVGAGRDRPADPRVARTLARLVTGAALAAAAVALVVLAGWVLGVEAPKQWLHGYTAMKTNAAVGTLLLAAALLLRRARPGTATVLAAAAGLIGLLTGVEDAFGVNLGIDELLFHERAGAVTTFHPNRMAVNTELFLVLLAAALVLVPRRRRARAAAGHGAALAAAVVALVTVVGLASGTRELTGIRHSTYIAIPAGVALSLLALAALFLRLDLGFARLFVRGGLDGVVLRRSMVAAVGVPIALGFGRTGLVDGLGFDASTASWLYAVVIILVLAVWALGTARLLARALAAGAVTNDRLRAIVDHSPLAVVTVDERRRVTSWNPAAEELFGWREAEVLGRTSPLADTNRELADVGRAVVDRILRRRDGSEVVVRVATAPLHAADGAFAGVSAVISDVTQERRAADRLVHLNEELERRVEERTAELRSFSYSISHDLRTPLRALDGFSQALLEEHGAELDDTARDYLGRIRGASQRMASLIDDVLGLSRVTRAELRRERIDVSELARAVASELALADPEHRVEVDVADGLVADGDPALVRVVLQNLLENAWKFTRDVPEPRVEVTAGEIGGRPGFAVSDNGVGFPEQYRQRLFRPFQRLHSTAAFPGNGIGLATVANIVYRHGGSLGAESPAGGGACFTFTLGGAPAAPAGGPVLAGVGTRPTP